MVAVHEHDIEDITRHAAMLMTMIKAARYPGAPRKLKVRHLWQHGPADATAAGTSGTGARVKIVIHSNKFEIV